MANRDEYFRVRTNIGKLEAAALRFAITKGHDPFVVRDDRQATSVGCYSCNEWGCAEIESILFGWTHKVFIVLTTLTNGCQVVPISVKRLTQFKQSRGQFKQTSKKVVLRKLFVKVIVFLSKRKRIVKEVRLDT